MTDGGNRTFDRSVDRGATAGRDGGNDSDSRGDRDGRDRRVGECAVCGTAIDPTDWHPATTTLDADGTVHVLVFCGEACREVRLDD